MKMWYSKSLRDDLTQDSAPKDFQEVEEADAINRTLPPYGILRVLVVLKGSNHNRYIRPAEPILPGPTGGLYNCNR